MNIGCDILYPESDNIEQYDLIAMPALYAASDELLARLNEFVKNGGNVVYTFKSGFTNEHVKVRNDVQPAIIGEACGIQYSQFVEANNVTLRDDPFGVGAAHKSVTVWMELLVPTTANVLAYYDHPHWGSYAAITEN